LLLFLVTPICAFVAVAAALASEPGELAGMTILMGVFGASAFLGGLVLVFLGPLFSKRTQVSIDLVNGYVHTAREPYPVPVSALTGFRISRPNPLSAFAFLEATRTAQAPLVLLGPVVTKHATDVRALGSWLGETLRVPLDPTTLGAPGAPAPSNPEGDKFAGMLCYFPIQGIFIFASLYYLVAAGKRRPFVRFCAIQSLSQFVFSIVVLAVILIALGVPVAFLEDSPLHVPLIVLLALALAAFWFWNFGAHVYACYTAYKGRAWVMPWLGFWSRRFLPA
jgi:uncharacterized membrane protein